MMLNLIQLLRVAGFPLLLALIITGCGAADPPADNAGAPVVDTSGYVAPRAAAVPTAAYPAGQRPTAVPLTPTSVPGSYPVEEQFAEPRFSIDEPLRPGDTTVSGQALPNLTVAIVDITFSGIVLGTARADGNGRFTATVEPLLENHSIGLALGALPAGQTAQEALDTLFPHQGDNARLVPNIGYFFDIASVKP